MVDPNWDLVTANTAAGLFLNGVAPHLLEPPVNVIRLSLHLDGMAPRVTNFDEYAAHVMARVRRTLTLTSLPRLEALVDEFGHLDPGRHDRHHPGILLPLELDTEHGHVRLFSTITTFGTPRDVTLEELAIETFYPTDSTSAANLARAAASSPAVAGGAQTDDPTEIVRTPT